MLPEDMRSSLEEELAWRQDELAFFKNQLANIIDIQDKEKYRKSLVLMLYSHLEGFIKISLQSYIQYINSLNIERTLANTNLLVSSMNREFNAYDNLDRKCDIFRNELPEDSRLHRFFRRVDLVDNLDEFKTRKLFIEDTTVDTESNLWYIVLQKNLYKIGLPVDLFSSYAGDIDALVNRRNSIAHGNFRAGITEREYENWERKIYRVMSEVNRLLYDYARNERYLAVVSSAQ